jgi:glycerophosphoryl diester phosphodiesterase
VDGISHRQLLTWVTLMLKNVPTGSIAFSIGMLLLAGAIASAAPSRALAGSTVVSQTVAQLRERLVHPRSDDTIVIAHRACWKQTSENSLAAVRACIAMHVDGVEFDVRHTKDGAAVIMHDENVDRTTDGHGLVASMTLAEIKALHLRRGAGGPRAAVTTEPIPTLVEYLAAAKGRLLLVFDVKDDTQEESFAAAQSLHVDGQAIFFYECRNDHLLNHIRPFWDNVFVFPIIFDTDGPLSKSIGSCKSNPQDMIHIKFTRDDFLEEASGPIVARQERVWIATMYPDDVAGHADAQAIRDPQGTWGRLMDAGANMIMTNEPAALLEYRRTRHGQRVQTDPP